MPVACQSRAVTDPQGDLSSESETEGESSLNAVCCYLSLRQALRACHLPRQREAFCASRCHARFGRMAGLPSSFNPLRRE